MKRVVFNNYKPKEILKAIDRIGAEESMNISPVRLHLYIDKILRGNPLKEVKLRKVFLGIAEAEKYLKETEKISKFYYNLVGIFKGTEVTSWDRWIFAMRHTMFNTYGRSEEHNILRSIFKEKLPDNFESTSLANRYTFNYVRGNKEMKKFYSENIYKHFIATSHGIESIYDEVGISSSTKLFHESIIEVIHSNIEDICIDKKMSDYSIEGVKVVKKFFSDVDRKMLFKRILNAYANRNISPKNFNSIWFNYILQVNGRLGQRSWREYTEGEKNTFRRWMNFRNIRDFFERHAIHVDRKEYWYGWMDVMEDSEIIEDFNLALIMKFRDHLIIEFGEVGAVRVYENNELSLGKIRAIFEDYKKTPAKRKIDDEYIEAYNTRWKHQGNWQWKFNANMDELGYRR